MAEISLLAVPNWSFGRDSRMVGRFREVLEEHGLCVHFCKGDPDHNRTVTAYSGPSSRLVGASQSLMAMAFDAIDLNRHVGVHPRIGALDVFPVLPMPGDRRPEAEREAQCLVEALARVVGERYETPVFLYERSERGRHAKALPELRRAGFGGLLDRELDPDFGPTRAHPRLGATVMGVRDFLVALNVNLADPDPAIAKEIARRMRALRGQESWLEGVRALGFPLASCEQSQVSMNLTRPDHTPIDTVLDWVRGRAESMGTRVVGPELIGVIREWDLEHATRIEYKPEQVVPTYAGT